MGRLRIACISAALCLLGVADRADAFVYAGTADNGPLPAAVTACSKLANNIDDTNAQPLDALLPPNWSFACSLTYLGTAPSASYPVPFPDPEQSHVQEGAFSQSTFTTNFTPSQGLTYAESSDAGQLLPGQATGSGGFLDAITGDIGPPNGQTQVADADVYAILLTANSTFSATVVAGPGTTSVFDSALFLFDSQGIGLAFRDDISTTNALSTISYTPTQTGTYFLAISGTPYFAADAANRLIFPDTTAFTGPSATGQYAPVSGAGALAGWRIGAGGTAGDFGSYRINLTNAQTVPEPAMGSVLLAGFLVGVMGRVRRLRREPVRLLLRREIG